MNWFESILYGIISGLTEFLPLSSSAHQQIFLQLCGCDCRDPARDMLVHIALIVSVWSGCRTTIDLIKREQRARGRMAVRNTRIILDQRLTKSAAIPMLIFFFILSYIFNGTTNLLVIALIMVLNGILLYIPDRMLIGNKAAGAMSSLDSIFIGASAALSAIPGFSRIGCAVSVAAMRGADRKNALNWALLLSIPALVAFAIVDMLSLFSGPTISSWSNFFHYLLSALGAYSSGYLCVNLIRFLTARQKYSIFAYYSWGAALFTFILYLTVV